MIVVRVELWSAISGERTELARMHISNRGDSTDPQFGNYDGQTFRGRNSEALDKLAVQRSGAVEHYPRQRVHVWNLVSKMLQRMGYLT